MGWITLLFLLSVFQFTEVRSSIVIYIAGFSHFIKWNFPFGTNFAVFHSTHWIYEQWLKGTSVFYNMPMSLFVGRIRIKYLFIQTHSLSGKNHGTPQTEIYVKCMLIVQPVLYKFTSDIQYSNSITIQLNENLLKCFCLAIGKHKSHTETHRNTSICSSPRATSCDLFQLLMFCICITICWETN
jgi:hypothetical protein